MGMQVGICAAGKMLPHHTYTMGEIRIRWEFWPWNFHFPYSDPQLHLILSTTDWRGESICGKTQTLHSFCKDILNTHCLLCPDVGCRDTAGTNLDWIFVTGNGCAKEVWGGLGVYNMAPNLEKVTFKLRPEVWGGGSKSRGWGRRLPDKRRPLYEDLRMGQGWKKSFGERKCWTKVLVLQETHTQLPEREMLCDLMSDQRAK